jgi:hypothetical protein
VPAAVWTVMVTVCAPEPAMMVAGEKVAVAPVGRPLTEKVTLPGYRVLACRRRYYRSVA